MYADGGTYDYEINLAQVRELKNTRTNRWLVLQGLTAQVAYGSLVWVPLLYQEKVIAEGYSQATGQQVGGLFAALFTIGALFSILFGHIGDRWQRKNLSGRAYVSAIGILGAIPFFLVFFWIPLRGLQVTDGASTGTFIPEVLSAIVTNPWVGAAFLTALIALALTSADSPNWFALISDVNLPEHRGTVFGVGNFVNGFGSRHWAPRSPLSLPTSSDRVCHLPTTWPSDCHSSNSSSFRRAGATGGRRKPVQKT